MKTKKLFCCALLSFVMFAASGCDKLIGPSDPSDPGPTRAKALIVPKQGGSFYVWLDTLEIGGFSSSVNVTWVSCSSSNVKISEINKLTPDYATTASAMWCNAYGNSWVCQINAVGKNETANVHAYYISGKRVDNDTRESLMFRDLSYYSIN